MVARKTPEAFIRDARAKHGDQYDYSLTHYTTARDTITIVCPKHGPFTQRAGEHLKYGCASCGAIEANKKIWSKRKVLARNMQLTGAELRRVLLVRTFNRATTLRF